jgi:tetratricopeptide (TPR) repeat protein
MIGEIKQEMGPHLTEREFLSLVDRACAVEDARRYFRHLLLCETCLQDFKYMARQRISGCECQLPDVEYRPPTSKPTGKRSRRRMYRIAAVAAGLALTAAAIWFWQSGVPESTLNADVTGPIRSAMTTFSNQALAVIPGAEHTIVTTGDAYRSGHVVDDEDVSMALLELSKRYQNGDRSREVVYWLLSGFVSTRQFETATDVARNALRWHPGDAELTTLSALAAYHEGDLETAKSRLRSVVESGTDSGVAAMNLGVLLLQIGERAEARAVLNVVYESQPDTPLGERANWLLNSYQY